MKSRPKKKKKRQSKKINHASVVPSGKDDGFYNMIFLQYIKILPTVTGRKTPKRQSQKKHKLKTVFKKRIFLQYKDKNILLHKYKYV